MRHLAPFLHINKIVVHGICYSLDFRIYLTIGTSGMVFEYKLYVIVAYEICYKNAHIGTSDISFRFQENNNQKQQDHGCNILEFWMYLTNASFCVAFAYK